MTWNLSTAEVAAVDHQINRVGSAMLFAPEVLATGEEAGVHDALLLYAGGRGGVLGAVTWQQVQSAFGFFPAEVVRGAWDAVCAARSPVDMAQLYAKGLTAHGRSAFPHDAAEVVVNMGTAVADTVTPMGYPMFVGWRDMERPDNPAGAAALVIMTLRELRGDMHLQDIAAAGISPRQAEVVARGVDGMALHGWEPPHPDPDEYRDTVIAATETTTRRMTAAYQAALNQQQWRELAAAIGEIANQKPATSS